MEILPSLQVKFYDTRCPLNPLDDSFGKPVDMKSLYSDKELKSIIKKFPISADKQAEFEVNYYPKKQTIVILNRSIHNSIVIDKNGKVMRVGCEGQTTELQGDYYDIFKTTAERYAIQSQNNDNNGNQVLSTQLELLSQLGKTKIK